MEKIIDLDVQVLTVRPSKVLVRWDFMPGKRRQEYTIELLRGEREQDMKPIATIDGSSLSMYIDYSLNLIDTHKAYFYSALVRLKATGETFQQEVTTWYGEIDLEAIYVAEEQEFLHKDAIGMPTFALLRKRDGAYCEECWDKISKKRIKSNCMSCFGTNFLNGYYSPLLKYVDFSPDNKSKIISQLGEMQPGESAATAGPVPILQTDDVLVEAVTGDRYIVKRSQVAEKRRIPLLQALVVELAPKSNVCYSVPIDIEKLTASQKELDKIKGSRGF